jgi:hypothetical protein
MSDTRSNLLLVTVFLAFASTTPHDSLDLRARYGEPDLERFTIRTDVTVIAGYSPDGKARMLEIEPRHAFFGSDFQQQPSMPKEAAMEALNELIPETRGKKLHPRGTFQSGCTSVPFKTFKGLSITEVSGCGEGIKSLTVLADLPTGTLPYTSEELHARYGSADLETFRVRPDITLTAEYGPDGQACAMRIESVHDLTYPLDAPAAPVEEVVSVLDEVVPPQARGKEIGPGEQIWGACVGAALPAEHENVTISSPDWMCDPHSKARGVDVHFKRSACEAFQPRRVPASR